MEIPNQVKEVIEKIEHQGYEAFVVGGSVRDLLLKKTPYDYDVATNAKPEEVKKMFKNSFLNNAFGTVTVLTKAEDPHLREVQVTTYRTEDDYQDQRHPQKVTFVSDIKEDLARRDFTVNAMALSSKGELIDPFSGQQDLKKELIRAVGNPQERIAEDALRMMRAVRFSAQLGFVIEGQTEVAIKNNAPLLKKISAERVRDEFVKIINTPRAAEGVEKLRELNLLQQFLPEVVEGYKVEQNKHHIYDCYEHSIKALEYAAKKEFSFSVRMASLLHDVGKPRSKRGEGEVATFHNHEVIGARITKNILKRLKFTREEVEQITLLVRYHLFYYNVGEVTPSSVRRLLRKVGKDNIEELLKVRMADRIGSGVPKAEPYRLRHLRYIIDKVSQDPVTSSMLKIDGGDVMKLTEFSPGPKVGAVLNILLQKVIEEPQDNNEKKLTEKVLELKEFPQEKLLKLGKEAKMKIDSVEEEKDGEIKKRHWVS